MAPFVPGRATANAAWALSWIGVDMVETEGDTMFLNQIQLQTKPRRLTRLSSLQDLQSYKSAKSPRAHVVAFLPSDTGYWPESPVEPPTTPWDAPKLENTLVGEGETSKHINKSLVLQ